MERSATLSGSVRRDLRGGITRRVCRHSSHSPRFRVARGKHSYHDTMNVTADTPASTPPVTSRPFVSAA